MGWRGALRSMAAASRAAARENERRAKHYAKAQMASQAADAVEEWENLIEKLTTVTTVIDEAMDWEKTAAQPEPLKPIQETGHQKRAQEKLDAFMPSFWDFLHGGSERRVQKLEQALSTARALDREEFETATRITPRPMLTGKQKRPWLVGYWRSIRLRSRRSSKKRWVPSRKIFLGNR
jgi:hypothetical protein